MNKSLRYRILAKLAQTQAPQTPQSDTTPTQSVAAPTAPPADLFVHLAEGYNGATVALLTNLTAQLNTALHYASGGKFNFQSIVNNNMDLSGVSPDAKNVGALSQRIYNTFLNRKNSFNGKKVPPATIHSWTAAITNSAEYNNLSQIAPTSQLSIKLGSNLKTGILNYMNSINQSNPAAG